MNAIVMCDKLCGIGYQGEQSLYLKNDLKRFRELTTNNIIIYGRKTLETFPEKKPLPNRINMILSNSVELQKRYPDEVYSDITTAAIDAIIKANISHCNIYVIGGESIFNQFKDYIDTVYMTRVDTIFQNCDKYFKVFECNPFELTHCEEMNDYDVNGNEYHTEFQIYHKV